MPQRFLRPGLTTSQKWNACSWVAQSFYVRLITLVDDFGRYDAHPSLLRGHAFAMREDIRTEDILEMCRELSESGLCIFFEFNNKHYLQLTNWKERSRSEDSKFPAFDNKSCGILRFDNKCSLPSSSPSPSSLVLSPRHLSGKPDDGDVQASDDTKVVLNYLNEKAERKFRPTSTNVAFISARLNEHGITVEGVKKMIDRQISRWKGTPHEEYLRPETLFNKTKFGGYYDNRELPVFQNGKPNSEQPDFSKGF